jgi:hypothetical protein
MLDWVQSHANIMWWLAAISALTFVTSIVAVPWLLVRIPAQYFMSAKHEHPWADRHPLIRHSFVIGKNILGLILIALGLAMLILPGQGLLTILAGLVLLDFPGKERVLLWTISQPAVLKAVNWIRGKAHHPPLVVPGAQ